jgi:subtilisin family serine protease
MVKWAGQDPVRIAVAADSNVADTVRYWSGQDNVEFAEPDGLVHSFSVAQSTSWGYDQVQAATAASTNNVTGAGIVVAVVDSGVDYLHEDLDANNYVNPGETPDNNVDDDGNGYVDDYYGYDFIGSLYTAVTPDHDPADEAGHGTHVAGIIAAENNSVGVKGIAPSAQIMPVKVLDASGSGWESTIADGIRYAVDEGADIINLSLGSYVPSNTIKSAVDYAETNNVLVIAAAGNDYSFTLPSYPAAYASVVSVGATTEDGFKADYSNWGKVDVMAPGDHILSSVPGDDYEYYSGTSMAAPHVTGVAALVMQKFGGNARLVRHILEHTADDFGTIVGSDYLSGSGTINALDATSNPEASTIVYAETGTVPTNGTTSVTVYASVRSAVNAAVSGDTVAWTTSAGTLSASSSTTNSSGIASISLTVDDADGLVTVTADPTSTAAATIQLALLNDVPSLPVIGVMPSTDSAGGEVYLLGGGDSGETDSDTYSVEDNVYQAGDDIRIYTYPTMHDLTTHNVTLSYSVTDPDGNVVTDLEGESYSIETGESYYGVFYVPQTYWESSPLTIPSDAASGQYTLTMTATDDDSAESSTTTSTFWVGEQPDVLVVANGGCSDAPIRGLSYGGVTHCTDATGKVVTALENLGYEVMSWDVEKLGTPDITIMNQYPLLVWLDTDFWPADSATIQSYLDAGGNLLLSSSNFQAYSTGDSFFWDYMHSEFVSTIYEPDTVTGTTDSIFAGQSYNIDPYAISGSGSTTNYSVSELSVNTNEGVNALQFSTGNGTDRSAAVQVETDGYRMVYLSFQLPGINDAGDATLQQFLETSVDWLRGDRPTITNVRSSRLKNSSDHTITIRGTNFQTTGNTRVKLRNRRLDNVVVESRTKITATVPAGLDPKRYSVTVVNPDGRKVTESNAVRVVNGGLSIQSVVNDYVSNNMEREVTVNGSHFHRLAKVYLGTTELTDVTRNSTTSLTVKVPANFTPDTYALKVMNPNDDVATHKGFTVRLGFTENLANGDSTDQVKALEKRLKTAGYFTTKADNTFDAATEEALVRYQTDNYLTVSGRLDAATRYYLNNNQ